MFDHKKLGVFINKIYQIHFKDFPSNFAQIHRKPQICLFLLRKFFQEILYYLSGEMFLMFILP